MVIKQEVVAVSELPAAQLRLLQDLYEAHYGGLHHFARDLSEKDWVLLLRSGQQVVGFSSLQRREQNAFVVYFSGDTLVLPDHRHAYDLPRLWGRFVFQQVARESLPCLWFLICGGFRTYRFLPVFFQKFYPRYEEKTPGETQALLDRLASQRYGDLYHEGIVRLGSPCLEELPPRELDAHARFFLERNPGWRLGHELACLTWLDRANLTPAGQRMVRAC
ncbi:MAG: hypothetical protein KF760_28270 [Candidatus Eremiobacteraeota bacterium]|nr:hypothetical protein [Candidatus Eremiobacteraeota bacterium]MCW5865792.1 hypothetical protein [Candidatus Eremiobacteraeota bacterium]